MSKSYDVVIVGGGHNSLAAATYLANAGRKVFVAEKRDVLGGLAADEEFHAGFHSVGVHHDTGGLRDWVVRDLDLQKHGLVRQSKMPTIFAPERNGQGAGLMLAHDPKEAAAELRGRRAGLDEAYGGYRAFLDRIRPFMRKVFDAPPPDVADMGFPGLWDLFKKAIVLRMLGRSDMMELLRIGPMCSADWMNEWFEDDLIKGLLSGPSVYSTFTGPWSPGSNINLLLHETLADQPIQGGGAAITRALAAAAKAAGVEIDTSCAVEEIMLKDGQVEGVRLAGKGELQTKVVAGGCDPRTLFLKLVDPVHLPQQFEHSLTHYRARGSTAILRLALREYPKWQCRPDATPARVRIGDHLDHIEKAYDAIKYRDYAKEPVFDIYMPTVESPELAPQGQHVAQVQIHFAPYKRDGGWNEAAREGMLQVALENLGHYAPNLRDHIVGHELLTPADLEDRYGLDQGHLHHGEHAADQLLVRPIPEISRYSSPIKGLFVCGGGGHPGGGITGAAGAFGARAVLGRLK